MVRAFVSKEPFLESVHSVQIIVVNDVRLFFQWNSIFFSYDVFTLNERDYMYKIVISNTYV